MEGGLVYKLEMSNCNWMREENEERKETRPQPPQFIEGWRVDRKKAGTK